MKRKLYILYAILSAIIYFSFLGSAIGGEKSVIIRFHQPPGGSEEALIHNAKGTIKHTHKLIPAVAANLPEEAIAEIAKNPRVAYVEDDSIVTAVEPLPGDEYLNSWGVQHIGAGVVHASGNKGAGVKIAVLDTGIDYTHEDLDDNFKGGDNFVQYDPPLPDFHDPFDDSWNSHGTNVAGIIAAEQNGTGVVGVAPEAEIYAVKVLDGMGGGYVSWVIAGIEWAVANDMRIINMSLAGTDVSQAFEDACDAAEEAGLLLVAAAGNSPIDDDGDGTTVTNPAAYSSVIAVAATDHADQPGWFSSFGPEVELAAPGVSILSTSRCNSYAVLSGTSQAAPHVVGTAALILSSGNLEDLNKDGKVNNKDVRLKLQMTAIDLGTPGIDPVFGYGLVDAAKAALPENDVLYLTITKTSKPALDAKTVSLSGGKYQVTIENNGLYKVNVKVSKSFNGNGHKWFNRYYWFNCKRSRTVTFNLDVTSTFDVTFVPYGKNGASANITIEKN